MLLRKAQKSISKLRIGLAGPSGSGKTYSALLLANGLTTWDKICVIDTERQSADLYSDLGGYQVITLEKHEKTSQGYVSALEMAEKAGMEVIIVDSITHEWKSCLALQEKLGGRWQDWAKVTPIHDRFIETMLGVNAHVITTVRSKSDYMMTQEGGKSTVQKVGLKQETREGFEYELTLSLDINIRHLASASKDRTGLFMDADPFVITQETGKTLKIWANSGDDPVKMARLLEELMPKKGVSLKNTLIHYKVQDLADLPYVKLLALENRLNEMPDVDKKVDKSVDKSKLIKADKKLIKTAKLGAEAVQAYKKAEARVRAEEIDVDEVDEAISEKEAKIPVKKATKGQVKILEMVIRRRAKQIKKGYESMRDAFLEKVKVKSFDDLDEDLVAKLTDMVTKLNAEYSSKKDERDSIPEAEKIFGAKAK